MKKKKWRRVTALSILFALISINGTANAAEDNLMTDTSVLKEYRIPSEEFQIDKYASKINKDNSFVSNDISEYNDVLDIPVYLLVITNEEDLYLTSAFYVEDSNHTGNTYLVTSLIADTFAEQGYSLLLYKDGYAEEVTDVSLDSSGTFAYLEAPRIENEIPMGIAGNVSTSNQAMLLLGMEEEGAFYLSYTELPLDSFEEYEEYFVGDEQLEDLLWLGSPVVDLNTFEVLGMVQMNSDTNLVINKMVDYDFSSGMAITEGSQSADQPEESETAEKEPIKEEEQTTENGNEKPVEEETEEPRRTGAEESETADEESKIPGWIVVAVVIILAAAIMNGKSKKSNVKRAEEKKSSGSYQEGTVSLEPKETVVQELFVDEAENSPAVRAVAYPQAGTVYRADKEGRIVFGRENSCQVRFEENDTKISKRHCVLYKTNQGLFLMDTGSTNGTFISETQRLRPNKPYQIQKGTAFFLSSPKYTFVITED